MKKPNKYEIAASSLLLRVEQFIEDSELDHESAAKLWRCVSNMATENARDEEMKSVRPKASKKGAKAR